MTRAQEIERKARKVVEEAGAGAGLAVGALVDLTHALALPAEGGEPKLETTWMTRASMKAAAEMKLPEETAAEEISNEMTLALLCDIDTLLARTNRDGVIEALKAVDEAMRGREWWWNMNYSADRDGEKLYNFRIYDRTGRDEEDGDAVPHWGTSVSPVTAIGRALAKATSALRTAPAQDATAKIVAERKAIEKEALRYAEIYPPGSDGRNTFVMFADWIAERSEHLKESKP